MSARYEGMPQVEFLPDGRNVRLTAKFVFYDPSERRWAVPAAAVVDGASIPKFLWSIIGGPFEGKYRDGSIIHDWYCDRRTRSWRATHRVFYDAICVSGVAPKIAKILYFGVRWKGPRWGKRTTCNANLPFADDDGRRESAEIQIINSIQAALLVNDYPISTLDTFADNLNRLEHLYLSNPNYYKTQEVTNFVNDHILRFANIPLEAVRELAQSDIASKQDQAPLVAPSYETITAVFDTAAHAKAAVDALKAGSFHADDISMFDKKRVGLREPGLWQRIFGGGLAKYEADVYSQSLDRGGMVVSVRVPRSEVAHATGILDIHRPIDVQDRAITTGLAPAAKVEAVAATVASIAVKPLEVAQKVALSPKLAEAHDEMLRLAEEQVEVGKRMIETGRTRVRRFVTEREVTADVTLHEEHAEILRRAVNDPKYIGEIDWADDAIEIREPAEQALVSKTARVVAEVGLRKIGSPHVETVHDKIRRQQVEIERLGPDSRFIR